MAEETSKIVNMNQSLELHSVPLADRLCKTVGAALGTAQMSGPI